MTYEGTFNVFRCNGCGEREQVHGFPEGWSSIPGDPPGHFCEICTARRKTMKKEKTKCKSKK